jgi:hypothetical protein
MITQGINKFSVKFQQPQIEQFCPECSSQMIEVDRCNENQALFVWYECSRKSCDGQWLQKMPVSILK